VSVEDLPSLLMSCGPDSYTPRMIQDFHRRWWAICTHDEGGL